MTVTPYRTPAMSFHDDESPPPEPKDAIEHLASRYVPTKGNSDSEIYARTANLVSWLVECERFHRVERQRRIEAKAVAKKVEESRERERTNDLLMRASEEITRLHAEITRKDEEIFNLRAQLALKEA